MATKRRRPNFSAAEVQCLLDGVEKRKKIVDGRLSDHVTTGLKAEAWNEICSEVNAVSRVGRTVEEIRKKWVDYKSVCKRREGQPRGSEQHCYITSNGGSSKVTLIPKSDGQEETVIAIIDETVVKGIEGAVEDDLAEVILSVSENDHFEHSSPDENNFQIDKNCEKSRATKSEAMNVGMKLLEGQKNIISGIGKLNTTLGELLEVQKQRLEIERELLKCLSPKSS